MKFLVTGEYVEPGPMLQPEHLVPMMEGRVLPSLQGLAQMESEGKIVAGGIHAGGRTGTMVVEAKSADAVDRMLGELPFWGLLRWTVTPLVSFKDRAKWESKMVAEVKKELAG